MSHASDSRLRTDSEERNKTQQREIQTVKIQHKIQKKSRNTKYAEKFFSKTSSTVNSYIRTTDDP